MPKRRVYLDYNATAPLRAEARDAMVAAFDLVGNPSSVHAEGRAAKGLGDRQQDRIAAREAVVDKEIGCVGGCSHRQVRLGCHGRFQPGKQAVRRSQAHGRDGMSTPGLGRKIEKRKSPCR